MGVGPCLSHTIPFSYSAYIAQGPTTCWYNIHKLLPVFWHSGHSLVLASVCQLPMNIFFSTIQDVQLSFCLLVPALWNCTSVVGLRLSAETGLCLLVTLERTQNGSHVKLCAIKYYILLISQQTFIIFQLQSRRYLSANTVHQPLAINCLPPFQ